MKVRKELIENAKIIDIATPEEMAWSRGYLACLDDIGTMDIDRLKELSKADQNDLVVILKCKPRDTVYFIRSSYRLAEAPIGATVIGTANPGMEDSIYTARLRKSGMTRKFMGREIGKTVFLTPEEAEKALEEAKRHG